VKDFIVKDFIVKDFKVCILSFKVAGTKSNITLLFISLLYGVIIKRESQ